MNELLVALPLLLPLGFAVSGLFFSRQPRAQRVLALAAPLTHLLAALALGLRVEANGPFVIQVGEWARPFGISLLADRAAVLVMVLAGLVALAATPHTETPKRSESPRRDFFPFFPLLLFGATGASLSGDLFNLYVWFEVMLVGSFVLLTYGGAPAQVRAALVYVSLNLLASAFYLFAVAIIYGGYGSLDITTLGETMAAGEDPFLHPAAWGFLLIFFLVKMAAFPFFAWLPTTYPRPPIAVAAFFTGILTKLAFFCLLRLWGTLHPPPVFEEVLIFLGAVTLLSGLSAALVEPQGRRFAAWLLAGEMGYLLLALGLGGGEGIASGLLLLIHTALATTLLLLVVGHLEEHFGEVAEKGPMGLLQSRPALAVVLGILALVLVGMPPFSGFVAKLALLRAAFAQGSLPVVVGVLGASLLALAALGKFWFRVCGGEPVGLREQARTPPKERRAGTALIFFVVLALPLAASALYPYCKGAATDLLGLLERMPR